MTESTTPSPRQMDSWIEKTAQGDRDALTKLYRATATSVYSYALSILKNRYDAEDVLHDCFITVQTAAGNYRRQETPMAWLLTITRNLCLKQLRSQSRTISLYSDDLLVAPGSDPEEKLLIRSCMEDLSQEEQQIVILHAVAGFRHWEIARHLGLKIGTVLSKYHRAIRKLKSNLERSQQL